MNEFVDPVTSVRVDLDDFREGLRIDPEAFISFMIPDELTRKDKETGELVHSPIPEFHPRVFRRMTDTAINYFVCAIPRDHAKTTLAKLAVVWYLAFTDKRFVVYVSNTNPIAVDACKDIAGMLLSPNVEAIFGPVEKIEWQDGRGSYKFRWRGKTCMIKAQGAGQQVRGLNKDHQRPDLAVVDDLEDMDNTASKPLQQQLIRWFYGSFYKALDKFDKKIIHLGNMLSNKCLLKMHCDDPDWVSMKLGALLSNGKPLWPEAWSIDALRADFRKYVRMGLADLWFAEMMNQPMAAGVGLIKSDQIPYCPLPQGRSDISYGFITIDPAISDQDWADECVVSVHGYVEGYWTICEYRAHRGIDPVSLWWVVLELADKWGVCIVGIESVAYQAALKFFFNHLKVQYNRPDIVCYDTPGRASKTQRLAGWVGWLIDESYRLPTEHLQLIEQLLLYNPTKRDNDDDIIDSAAQGPYMIENYEFEITQSRELMGKNSRLITAAEAITT